MKKLSEMTDEERYGKVGAEIRRLDPEAYKNRPRTLEGNLNLLKELRKRKAEGSDTKDEESQPARDLRPARNPRYATGPEAVEARRRKAYLERNPQYREREPGLQAVDEELLGPKAKAAAIGAGAAAAGYGLKKARDFLMRRGEKVRREATDVAKGDLAMARSAAAREAEAAAYAERIKNARRSPGMTGYKRGGTVKSSASRRADGIAKKGKTRGRYV